MMGVFRNLLHGLIDRLAERPGANFARGGSLFLMALFGYNAVYGQSANHPDPIWQTRQTIAIEPRVRDLQVVPDRKVTLNPALVQNVRLSSVPVPSSRPALNQTSISGQASLVRDVQQALKELGLYTGKVDGISGEGTRSAIITFQKQGTRLPDGEVSYTLLADIRSAVETAKAVASNANTQTRVNLIKIEPIVVPAALSVEPNPTNAPAKGVLISVVQQSLKHHFGMEDIVIDGLMGEQTRAALRQFQSHAGIDETGELDASTQQKLRDYGLIDG